MTNKILQQNMETISIDYEFKKYNRKKKIDRTCKRQVNSITMECEAHSRALLRSQLIFWYCKDKQKLEDKTQKCMQQN